MAWRVFAASAIGKSHIDAGTPCQDASAHDVEGDTVLAVVCDGAGSQPLSHVGAQAMSRMVVQALTQRVAGGEDLPALAPEAFHSLIAEVVDAARITLAAEAATAGVEFASYSSTLVGAVANAERGYFFHIGDGQGAAEPQAADQAVVMSLPENGEYANETYFVTGEAWREHLRITPIAVPMRTIALMSDGAAPFVMTKGNVALYRPFMDPVERYLASATEADGCAALASTLEDPRTYGITGDDKTLLLALWQ